MTYHIMEAFNFANFLWVHTSHATLLKLYKNRKVEALIGNAKGRLNLIQAELSATGTVQRKNCFFDFCYLLQWYYLLFTIISRTYGFRSA